MCILKGKSGFNVDEILKVKADDLCTKICSGEIKSLDVVKACVARIKRTNSKVGAFLKLNEKKSLEQAECSDRKIESGEKLIFWKVFLLA